MQDNGMIDSFEHHEQHGAQDTQGNDFTITEGNSSISIDVKAGKGSSKNELMVTNVIHKTMEELLASIVELCQLNL